MPNTIVEETGAGLFIVNLRHKAHKFDHLSTFTCSFQSEFNDVFSKNQLKATDELILFPSIFCEASDQFFPGIQIY